MQLHVALYRQVAFLWNTQCYLWHQCPALQARSGYPVPCYATPIQMGSIQSGPLRWIEDRRSTPRPGRFTPGEEPLYPLYGSLDECQGRCEWNGEEGVSFPTGVRTLNRPAHSELLYRLNYPTDVDTISRFCASSLFVSKV